MERGGRAGGERDDGRLMASLPCAMTEGGGLRGGDVGVGSWTADLAVSSILRCSRLLVASGVLPTLDVSPAAVTPRPFPSFTLIAPSEDIFAACATSTCGSDRLLPVDIAFRIPAAFLAGDCNKPLWPDAFGETDAVDVEGFAGDPIDGVFRCRESRREGALSSFAEGGLSFFVIRQGIPFNSKKG